MANPEHVALLKKGVKYWNEWRWENWKTVIPDLSEVSLPGANLREADFRKIDLRSSNFSGANLQKANLQSAIFKGANLQGTLFQLADLQNANFQLANMQLAILAEANLRRADFQQTNLQQANLEAVDLLETNLKGVNFKKVHFGNTRFTNVDLSECQHLESCHHHSPSYISTTTFEISKGQIPTKILRGCGLSDWEIESAKLYQPGLSNEAVTDIIYRIHDIRTTQAIQINPLFISYTHDDSEFVDKVGDMLTQKGVRFWRDIHHATAGKLERQVDRAMRLHPTVLLVLSKNSTNSDWVEHEAKKARTLEKELGRDVICPVALDDSWKTCKWPTRLREQVEEYKILDFSDWQDRSEFEGMFAKLLQGLDLFYKD